MVTFLLQNNKVISGFTLKKLKMIAKIILILSHTCKDNKQIKHFLKLSKKKSDNNANKQKILIL